MANTTIVIAERNTSQVKYCTGTIDACLCTTWYKKNNNSLFSLLFIVMAMFTWYFHDRYIPANCFIHSHDYDQWSSFIRVITFFLNTGRLNEPCTYILFIYFSNSLSLELWKSEIPKHSSATPIKLQYFVLNLQESAIFKDFCVTNYATRYFNASRNIGFFKYNTRAYSGYLLT